MGYIVFFRICSWVEGGFGTFWVVSAIAIAVHFLFNVVISIRRFVEGNKEEGQGYLLSALVVLLVGYPACFISNIIR